MSTTQLFFPIAGLFAAFNGLLAGFLKYYIDAKIDPLAKQVDLLVHYMVNHAERISALEARPSGGPS